MVHPDLQQSGHKQAAGPRTDSPIRHAMDPAGIMLAHVHQAQRRACSRPKTLLVLQDRRNAQDQTLVSTVTSGGGTWRLRGLCPGLSSAPGVCEVHAQVVQGRLARGLSLREEAQHAQHGQPRVLDLLQLQLLRSTVA